MCWADPGEAQGQESHDVLWLASWCPKERWGKDSGDIRGLLCNGQWDMRMHESFSLRSASIISWHIYIYTYLSCFVSFCFVSQSVWTFLSSEFQCKAQEAFDASASLPWWPSWSADLMKQATHSKTPELNCLKPSLLRAQSQKKEFLYSRSLSLLHKDWKSRLSDRRRIYAKRRHRTLCAHISRRWLLEGPGFEALFDGQSIC